MLTRNPRSSGPYRRRAAVVTASKSPAAHSDRIASSACSVASSTIRRLSIRKNHLWAFTRGDELRPLCTAVPDTRSNTKGFIHVPLKDVLFHGLSRAPSRPSPLCARVQRIGRVHWPRGRARRRVARSLRDRLDRQDVFVRRQGEL